MCFLWVSSALLYLFPSDHLSIFPIYSSSKTKSTSKLHSCGTQVFFPLSPIDKHMLTRSRLHLYAVGDVSARGHSSHQRNPTSTLTFWMLLKALCCELKGSLSATCPIYPSVSGGQSFCSDWTQEDWSSRSEMSLEGIFSPWDDWLLHRD